MITEIPTSSEFVKALAAAQAEMKHALLDKVNPHFKSKYASLGAVIDATLPVLARHNIVAKQRVVLIDGRLYLKTWLEHPSGEKDEPSYWPIAEGTPQQMGSSLTYARRYGLSCVGGIASEEDDDGNAASTTNAKVKSAYRSRKDGDYPKLEAEIRSQETLDGLKQWWIDNQDRIRDLPTQWVVLLEEEKDRRKLELADELSATEPA